MTRHHTEMKVCETTKLRFVEFVDLWKTSVKTVNNDVFPVKPELQVSCGQFFY